MYNTVPQQKLVEVNRDLGNPAITQQQATCRTIYDTIVNTATTHLEFFTDLSNKTIFETNLQTNKLDSQESMIINEIVIAQERPADGTGGVSLDGMAIINVFVGNNRVIKDLPFGACASTEGLSYHPVISNNSRKTIAIPMLTSITIPPQVSIKVVLDFGADLPAVGKTKVMLKGYGTLFNPGRSL
jgi:hypothetical protein